MTIPTSGWTGTGASPDVTVPSSGYMDFHPTGIVQQWYTRRGQSWSPDFGLMIKMNSEGSTHGEVEFDRYNDASDSFHPKLTITYVEPRVQIDFDPTLGATYAPSSMVIGQTAKLPIQVRNNASGYTFNHCLSGTTTDCYQIGYRWFDAKGALVSSNEQDFTADLTTGSLSALFALAVTPPGTAAAQDTLRLDLVHRIGGSAGTYLWASDWALPSRYYSRNKRVLTTDSTRWVGSSRIERDEFGITLVTGAGSSQGEVQTVSLGDGGSAGINLWSGDLQYTGSGGVGFKDLATVGLSYGYDSANVADCTGILAACGWYTNYDERLTPTATVGDYTYQGPSGNRYYVGRDGDGQLTSAAPILLERPRVTFFDETGPSSGATALWTTAQHYTGAGSLAAANNVIIDSGVPVPVQPHLQDYPLLRFAIKTSAAGASMAGIRFKIHDLTDTSKTDVWLVYTVGNTSHTWSTGLAQIDLTDAFTPGGGWTETASRNLFGDARTAIGAATYDDLTVLNFQIEGNTGLPAGNTTWVDSVRLEPQRFVYTSNGQSAWTAHGQAGTSTDHPSDPLITLTTSAAITPTTIPASPDCVGCTGGGGALGLLPFVSWSWKKVGGTSIATILHLKDLRLGSGGPGAYLTGDLTYYAGRVAPPGAANPIQVSDTVPTDWTLVRRNVLEDARQVLNFFDDQDTTGTSTSPSGAPTPDDVLWTGWRFAVVDGNFGLWNVLAYDSQPRLGEKAGQSMADDYMATYGGGAERHYFNRDGLLTQIVTRNGDTTTLDWTFSHGAGASGQSAYTLTAIHAPTDATSSGGATLDRQIDVSRSGSSPIITTFAETLGSTVSHVSAPRQTVFSVATATGTGIGIGDVISIVPARAGTSACAGTAPIGCAKYTYSSTTSHLLSRIGDPRWDGTTSGTASDLTFGVTYDGSKRATSITDNSKSAAPLARVVSFDTGTSVGYRRALWQNADALAAGYGIHSDLSPDGALAVDHVPQVCTSGDCVAHPPANDDPTLNALISQASAFDGLGRVSTSTTYRVSGGTPQLVVSRQATKAGAKVDNFDDPLVANELAWTQSPDEYVASLQDSGRTDPDLYRTTYAYNALGQTTDTITPIENGKTGYAATVTETTNGTAIGPKDYYRLDEASCANPAADSGTAPHNGAYTTMTSCGTAGSGALVGVTDPGFAPAWNGTTSSVSATGFTSAVSGAFSVEAWVFPTSMTADMAVIGTRNNGFSFDLQLCVDATYCNSTQNIRVALGDGTKWLSTANTPYAWQLNRWTHIVAAIDSTAGAYSVFVNGSLVGRNLFTTAGTGVLVDSTHNLYIGQEGYGAGWFAGRIDEVAVYPFALDGDQVMTHYQAGRALAFRDAETFYDALGNVTQTDDNTYLANPAFESGTFGWQGTASAYFASAGDANLHQPTNDFGSLNVTGTAKATQTVTLAPGQTVRFQLWDKTGTGAHGSVLFKYWRLSTPGWVDLVTGINPSDASWTSHAWDAVIPMDSDGRVQVTLWNDTGTGTTYFDDLALLTSWGSMSYTVGVPTLPLSTCTLQPNQGASATLCVRTGYGTETSPYAVPAIFPKTVTADYVDGTYSAASPDEDLITTTTFDAWGRATKTTDPDGVSSTTDYSATNQSDIDDTKDGLGKVTSYAYDAVGDRISVGPPLHETTTTTYDLLDHPLIETAPDGTKAANVYNNQGQRTNSIANYVDGSPSGASGTDDLTTTYLYDAFGQVTSTIADDGTGLIKAKTSQTYDLLGNVTSTTVYSDTAYSDARTTTAYFDTVTGTTPLVSRPKPTGSAGPILPGGTVPACPGTTSTPCNAVTTLDAAGRAVISTDAYNVATRTYLDLAGRPVQVIANFVDGAYSPSAKDTDLATTMSYDILGKPTLVSDVLSHRTTTAYDKMERPIEVQQLDTAGAGVNSVKTAYTPGGRTDRVARPAAVGAADSARTWTKTVYDLAGRAIATLGHYDPTGTAQIAFDPLEGPLSDRWAAGGDALYNAPASTGMDDAYSAQGPRSGTGRLRVTTNTSTTNEGVRFDLNTGSAGILLGTVNLAPPSFVNQHTYTLHADVFATGAGNSVAAILGSATVHGSVASVTPNGVWMPIEATWTVPSGPNVTTGAEAVIRLGNGSATATSFYIDNVWVWDSSSAGFNPNGTDQNIPSLSVFDDDGRPVESILPPHALPTIAAPSQPLVTATAYDLLGRPASVSVNATASYPSTVASDTDVGYWPLDERAGTTIHDKASTADLTLAGGAVLAAASALDEARTGIDFDGSSGVASRTSAVSSLTNNFTFEAWFRADGLPSAGNYSVVAYNGTETAGWGIGLDSTGALVARYGSVNWLATTAIVKTGTYHHAALVRNAGTATLYLDGTAYAPTNATSTPGAPGASFSIGREDATAGRYFNGVVDDVAVYGTALSSTRIAAHATAGRNTAADTNLTSRTAYDALGRAVDGYDPRMIRTHEEYDRLGRVTATTLDYIDGTASGATNDDDVRSRYAYDAIGELTAFCPANAVYGADACDPTSTATGTAAYQSGWHYTYDKAGHVASQVAPVNTQLAVGLAAKFWTYDAGGRLTTQCDVAAGGTCGSPLRHTDMTFDGIGRTMTVKTYLGAGTSGNLKLSWTKTYDADSTLTKVDFDGTGSSESTDATNLVYDTAGRLSQVKDAALNVVTSYDAYNPDGTVWKRTDLGQTQAAFTYDYAGRLASSTYPSVFSGTISDTYGPDGLLTKRTWPTNGETATLTYDGAKRPTQVSYSALSSNLSETYDRDGNVTGEGRSLTNVSTTSGDAGGHTQSFVYDKLNRVSSASGLTAGSSTYTYDLDSNRTAVTALGVATTFAYDRTDELVKETISGTNTSFVYDAYGNLTKSATSSSTQTTNAYDLGDRLTSITPASGSSATFTLDALGRFKTRLVSGSTTETYSYLGTSETAWKIAGPTVTTCALDAAGSRTAENVGGTVGFLVFDVHGDVAAAETAAQTAYAAAIRYDPYGQTADTYKSGTGGIDLAWKFQGRLDIAPSGAPLYDAGARFYAPYLGQFTQLDSVTGRPTDPRSMNRFLYAEGNPWSMVDPSGHGAYYEGEGCGAGSMYCGSTGFDQNAHNNASQVASTGNSHAHDQPHGPAWTPLATPTTETDRAADNPIFQTTIADRGQDNASLRSSPTCRFAGRAGCVPVGSGSGDASGLIIVGGVVLGAIACVAGVCEAIAMAATAAGTAALVDAAVGVAANAAVGALTYAGSKVLANSITGKKWNDGINPTDALIAAATGGLAGPLIGQLAPIVRTGIGVTLGGASELISRTANGRAPDNMTSMISGVAGGVAGWASQYKDYWSGAAWGLGIGFFATLVDFTSHEPGR